ncbi:MAG: addiction module toxin RelE [Spirochaetales bacterium]
MKREFVETRAFSNDWQVLGQSDDDLKSLQNHLAKHPNGGSLIEGTGGARKIRWNRSGRPTGKSGGVRVLYLDDARDGKIYLVVVFGKDEKDNLSADEKKAIKAFIRSL